MNIVIDPYMFELNNENDILLNLSFFQKLIFLCNNNRIKIFLYEGLLNKLWSRDIKPFPIYIGRIKDEERRQLFQHINEAFVNAVMRNIIPLDIQECFGAQEFKSVALDEDDTNYYFNDSLYYDLMNILLQSCYNKTIELSPIILTGNAEGGKKDGKGFSLICECGLNNYSEQYLFRGIEEFGTKQDNAYIELINLSNENIIQKVDSPDIERGKHHNKLQFNSDFDTYEGLSRKNKSVISILRFWGLTKIIFGEFHEDSSYPVGTIRLYDIQQKIDKDIVKGWLYAETGYINHVDLYFPPNVGKNLMIYLNNLFDKEGVTRLKDIL